MKAYDLLFASNKIMTFFKNFDLPDDVEMAEFSLTAKFDIEKHFYLINALGNFLLLLSFAVLPIIRERYIKSTTWKRNFELTCHILS